MRLPVLIAILGSVVTAQFPQSASYRVEAWDLAGSGGGSSSPARAGHVSVLAAGGRTWFGIGGAELGLLHLADPLQATHPVIHGVTPARVSLAGGETVTLFGRGFGASPTVLFDGQAAQNVVAQSQTVVQADTPALEAGPRPVSVTAGAQTTIRDAAVLVNPTLLLPSSPVVGSLVDLVNLGPPGGTFQTWFSFTTAPQSTPIGLLHLDPFTAMPLFPVSPYVPPEGLSSITIPLLSPALSGFTVHLQSIAFDASFGAHLSNGVTMTVQ